MCLDQSSHCSSGGPRDIARVDPSGQVNKLTTRNGSLRVRRDLLRQRSVLCRAEGVRCLLVDVTSVGSSSNSCNVTNDPMLRSELDILDRSAGDISGPQQRMVHAQMRNHALAPALRTAGLAMRRRLLGDDDNNTHARGCGSGGGGGAGGSGGRGPHHHRRSHHRVRPHATHWKGCG